MTLPIRALSLRPAALLLAATLMACGGASRLPSLPAASGCAPAPSSSQVISVRDAGYGAKGDGSSDDTAAIQKAIDAIAGTGGTVLIPDGIYLINAIAHTSGGLHGIDLRSNMTLRLSAGAVLRAIPNASQDYAVLTAALVSDVNIIGGTIEGERSGHTGTGGEWGMGISLLSASRIVVESVLTRECWGDGIYIAGNQPCLNITLCSVTADHNRRQGMSVVNCDGLVVRNCTFRNTGGTLPEAGIDIEPNSGQAVNHVVIQNCTFSGNAGDGLAMGVPVAQTSAAAGNVVVDGNSFISNGAASVDGSVRDAIEVSNCGGTQITGNSFSRNIGRGILLRDNAHDTLIKGNTLSGTLTRQGDITQHGDGGGIYLASCAGSLVTGNTVTGNAGNGILQATGNGATLAGNTVSGNGLTP